MRQSACPVFSGTIKGGVKCHKEMEPARQALASAQGEKGVFAPEQVHRISGRMPDIVDGDAE